MSKQYACPICGKTFGKIGSVKSHITGSQDTDHKGKNGHQDIDESEITTAEIDGGEGGENTADSDGGSDGGQDTPPDAPSDSPDSSVSDSSESSGTNPALDAPPASPTDTSTGKGSGDSPAGDCPECGENTDWFDAAPVGYDWGCPSCSTKENWVVWNE